MSGDSKCGFCGIYPRWLQSWATSRSFIAVYGVLGTIQSMAFIYIVVSLTTLEKRFKIPSRTTGLILSGNEISQILSILLIYYGGSGHRPRWIAAGVACSAVSCLVLALPHLIYGPGGDALALTKEYLNASLITPGAKSELPVCTRESRPEACDGDALTDKSIVPRLLVFFSQFILGIGTTLYYGLGQTYLDDNSKKKNTPMLLGFTFALRTIGPAFGFVLGYLCLNIYIAPSLHPIIDKKDPRWLGAWWLGWLILAVAMTIIAILLAMFPQELRKSKKSIKKELALSESEMPLKIKPLEKKEEPKKPEAPLPVERPTLKDFPKTTKRILTNKLLMVNIFSGVFYILSASPFMSYIAKYLEVLFQTSPGGGTIVVGPLTLIGMILGFIVSGVVIGKFKPSSRPLMFWNVVLGVFYFCGQLSFMFFGCKSGAIEGINFDTLQVNLTSPCNAACNCDTVKYAPVCHEASETTFFSACHAGCRTVINDTTFADCGCVAGRTLFERSLEGANLKLEGGTIGSPHGSEDWLSSGPCKQNCFRPYVIFCIVSILVNILGCSGRIGNVLVNYRCVETRDKSLAQGIALMLVSLFALIPGPIIFGWIMDSTCLVWDVSCKTRGNCWIYHRDNFRYYVNLTSACLSIVGTFFDAIVCYLAKDIDLYGDIEEVAEKKKQLSSPGGEMKLNNQEGINPKQPSQQL